jgi:hypothetical protein
MGWPTGSHGKEYEVVELGPLNGFQPKDWEEKEISFPRERWKHNTKHTIP